MTKIMTVLVLALALAAQAFAGEITKEEYEAAIASKGFNRSCLRLQDQMRGLMSALAAANGDRYTTTGTGFSVEVCSPANWISRRFEAAKRAYKPLAWEDLTADDRADVLRVIALPDRTTNLNVENTIGVEHVVIRHPSKKGRQILIAQPEWAREFAVEEQNNLGGRKLAAGVEAAFLLARVLECRDEKGEFLVTVVGEKGEKNFKVKGKHLDDLGLKVSW